jgi:FKBP12-rapamycin complex-associated protein
VFTCLRKNLNTYEGFSEFLNVQSHFLKLFVCLSDRNIEIQETTLEILCKLSRDNPSDIVPFLKKTLYQYLFNLSIMDQSNFNDKKNILQFLRCIIMHGTSII